MELMELPDSSLEEAESKSSSSEAEEELTLMVEEVQVQVAVEQEAIHILYQVLQEPMAWVEAQAEAA